MSNGAAKVIINGETARAAGELVGLIGKFDKKMQDKKIPPGLVEDALDTDLAVLPALRRALEFYRSAT